ncbi:MAG: helix-turn-helix domain-containing protein [Deltaproteobacteria bacterium]|nr:helix-turn-helix domain-containing protein [Candidatus Tharpella aukensis]
MNKNGGGQGGGFDACRNSHYKTQKEVAKIMGLSQSVLSELERRLNITISVMQRYISLGR